MTTILHVTSRAAWEQARASGVHSPPELARDGFLHCCTEAQLTFVLGRHFAGATGLVVLEVDAEATGARVDWVGSEPDQSAFPHLSGSIPVRAVLSARSLG